MDQSTTNIEQNIKNKLINIQNTINQLKNLSDLGVTGFKETQLKLIDEYIKYSKCLDIILQSKT